MVTESTQLFHTSPTQDCNSKKKSLLAAVQAHRYFYTVGAIGWDIAISEKGPVFIEGNDNFEISLMQAVDGVLKDKWYQYVREQ